MLFSNIKNRFVRKTIKEVAQQVADMPDEPPQEVVVMNNDNKTQDEFISKRDMCFLMIGVFTGYLLFHNSFRVSSKTIRERF